MAIFTAFILCLCIVFYRLFFTIAIANIYLNGIIIGTTLFGIIICFIKIFALVPEHKWLREYTRGVRNPKLPPRLLRSVAMLLQYRKNKLTADGLRGVMEIIQIKMDDDRESVQYTVWVKSDVPVCACFGRLDVRQTNMAYYSVEGYSF